MKKQKFTIQIEQSICVSREVTAESMEQAVQLASQIANSDQLIKSKSKAWSEDWGCCGISKVIGVFG